MASLGPLCHSTSRRWPCPWLWLPSARLWRHKARPTISVNASCAFDFAVLLMLLQNQLGSTLCVVVNGPRVSKFLVSGLKVSPSPFEPTAHISLGDIMSAALHPKLDSEQRELHRVNLQEHHFDGGFNPFPQSLHVCEPLKVVSKAISFRSSQSRSNSLSRIRAAATCAAAGAKGERPAAIKSAFTNCSTPASFGRNSFAKVVFPAPFGPAITMQRGLRLAMGGKGASCGRTGDLRPSASTFFLAHRDDPSPDRHRLLQA
jgi:hypothetical protein